MTEENIFKILTWARDISPNWLLTPDDQPCPQGTLPLAPGGTKGQSCGQKVPLFNLGAVADAAALPESLKGQSPVSYLEIPNLPGCDGAVRIVGDNMHPLLKSGDIVVYKVVNSLDSLFWGEMYLLSVVNQGDAFVTVRYLQRSEREGYVRLISQNQAYQDKEIPLEVVKFAALVKASIRINSMV